MPSFLHNSDSDRRLLLNRSGASTKSNSSGNSSFTLSSGKPIDEVVDGLMKRRRERYDYAWTKAYNKYSLLDYCEVPKLVVRQCTAWAGEQLRSVKKAIQWREPIMRGAETTAFEQRNLFNSSKSRTANYLPFPPPPPSSAPSGGFGCQAAATLLLFLFVAAVLLGAVVQQHRHQTSELLQIDGGDCNIDHAASVLEMGMVSDEKMMLSMGDKEDNEKGMSNNGELDVECRRSPPPPSSMEMEMMGSVAVPCCTVCTCKCACTRNTDNLEQYKSCTSELAMNPAPAISQNKEEGCRTALGDEQNELPMGSADNSSALLLHGKKGNETVGWRAIWIRLGVLKWELM